jgi:predicted nucleic acid-binding protein
MSPRLDACVLDASVALKMLIAEDGSDAAEALLYGPLLHGPMLIHAEVANATWRMARMGRLSADDAETPSPFWPACHCGKAAMTGC